MMVVPLPARFQVGLGMGGSFKRESSPVISKNGQLCWNLKSFCWDKVVPPSIYWLFVGLRGLWGRKCPNSTGCSCCQKCTKDQGCLLDPRAGLVADVGLWFFVLSTKVAARSKTFWWNLCWKLVCFLGNFPFSRIHLSERDRYLLWSFQTSLAVSEWWSASN